jgi:hypothetical protein
MLLLPALGFLPGCLTAELKIAPVRKAAEAGDVGAMCRLGDIYSVGNFSDAGGVGIIPDIKWDLPFADYAAAMKWYRKAVDAGSTYAMAQIGMMYWGGKGVAQDYGKAMVWYRKAADAGDTEAMVFIGQAYEHAYGVKEDRAEARIWYRKAADLGNIQGMADFAFTAPDNEEFKKWFTKANEAELDQIVGFKYRDGKETPPDYAALMKQNLKAAEEGDYMARINIGYMYSHGLGVACDHVKAQAWYLRTRDFDMSDRCGILETLSATGDPDATAVVAYMKSHPR